MSQEPSFLPFVYTWPRSIPLVARCQKVSLSEKHIGKWHTFGSGLKMCVGVRSANVESCAETTNQPYVKKAEFLHSCSFTLLLNSAQVQGLPDLH